MQGLWCKTMDKIELYEKIGFCGCPIQSFVVGSYFGVFTERKKNYWSVEHFTQILLGFSGDWGATGVESFPLPFLTLCNYWTGLFQCSWNFITTLLLYRQVAEQNFFSFTFLCSSMLNYCTSWSSRISWIQHKLC